jgi:hypothetical protein
MILILFAFILASVVGQIHDPLLALDFQVDFEADIFLNTLRL